MWIRKPIPGGAIDALDYNFGANGNEKKLHRERYEWARQRISEDLILDLATGYGYGTKILYSPNKTVIGVDKSLSYVNFAKRVYSNYDNSITFIVIDLENEQELSKIELLSNVKKVAVSLETIEHLEKPEIMINWIHNNCNKFLLSAPIKKKGNDKNKHHAQIFRNKQEIINLVSRKDWGLKEEFEQSNHVLLLRLEKK